MAKNVMDEIKNHPMYHTLSMMVGTDVAAEMVKKALDLQSKQNQSVTEFSKDTKKIILPVSMSKKQASEELSRQWEDEETIINIDKAFENWNWKDILVAIKKASERHFGWIQGQATESFFGIQRPSEIEIIVDIKDGKKITESCFYGKFAASVWEDAEVRVGATMIRTTTKKRYANEVREFYEIIQKILDTESIYRGKAIAVTADENPWGGDETLNFDIFEMHVSDKIFLNADVDGIIDNFIIDELGEQGKRCYLFSGSYGNGKTETAMAVGGKGIEKGMAYFYCKDSSIFPQLLAEAVNYTPAICFLEDVDEITSGSERNSDINQILNTLDGVQTKGNNLTVIFTTNHEKRINPALRRPGRIDMVVNFENPEKAAIVKIYEAYLKGIPGSDKLDYNMLAEYTPVSPGAVVAEMAKRAAKLCTKKGKATNELVKTAIDSMKHHLNLMQDNVEESQGGKMCILVSGANMQMKDLNGEEKVLEKMTKK